MPVAGKIIKEYGRTPAGALVYALGSVGYDFGNNPVRDAFSRAMAPESPLDTDRLLHYLDANPEDAADLIWTLNMESAPIYAIRPGGPYARDGYVELRQFLRDQMEEGAERISLPGVIVGHTTLSSGQMVPTVEPDVFNMYNWTTRALGDSVAQTLGAENGAGGDHGGINGFLDRVYYQHRNVGLTPRERALNFAAVNAFQAGSILAQCHTQGLVLDDIGAEPASVYRTGADCWDITLAMIDPPNRPERAKKVYRFTIDVTDVAPVMVGEIRSWYIYE